MADATQDDGVLFKKTILGIDLEYTKTDAAIDAGITTAGLAFAGVGAAPAAGIAAARAGVMMVGRGILRSIFKTAAKEGAEVVAKTALKEGAEATAKAAVKEGTKEAAEAAAKKGTVEWVAPTLSKETAEFAAKKAAERTAREAAEATAKAGIKEGAEAAAKTVTKEAVESTSKSLLGTAGKALGMAWSGAKIVSFPFRHPVLTLGGISALHLGTGGKSSELIWDGAIGTWGLAKEYVPSAAAAVAEGTLKLGDGMMGFLATGGKKGAEGLAEHLPPGTPVVLREALGSVGKKKEEGAAGPSLRERAAGAFDGAKDKAEDVAEDVAENTGDFLEGEQAKPFRDMLGKFMGMDGKQVNGKALVGVLTEKAKDNPHIALGMAIGAMSGMKNSNSKMEMAWKVPLYSAMWGIAFMMLGPILQPLMGMLGQKMDGLKDQFHKSQVAPYANGALPSTAEPKTAAPAADKPAVPSGEAKTMALFQQNGASMTDEAPAVVVPAARRPVMRPEAVMV